VRDLSYYVLALGMLCMPVCAEEVGVLHPYVDYSYTYDDNVLRQNNVDPSVPHSFRLSDTIQYIQAGIDAEKKVGQQQLNASASINHTWFTHLNSLDYDGQDVSLGWKWRLGNHIQGNLSSSYSKTLTPFVDFHGEERNLRNQNRTVLDASWNFHPSWQVRSGLTHYGLTYDLYSQKRLDRMEDTVEFGLDYLATTQSSIGLQTRHIRGRLPNNWDDNGNTILDDHGNPVDNSYIHNEFMGKFDWHITGKSRVQLLGGLVQRKHDSDPGRDFNGFNSRAIANWMPTSKVGLTLNAWREIGSYDNLTASYTLNRGVSLAPTWDLTDKLRMEAMLRYEKRDYTGDAIVVSRQDNANYLSLSLEYFPWQKVQVGLTAYRDVRSSSAVDAFNIPYNYRANGVVINSRYKF